MKYWYRIILFFSTILFNKNPSNTLVGDIKNFTFEEILLNLKRMKVTIFNKTDDGYMARFSDSCTEYVLSFDSSGKVRKIESEYWKDYEYLYSCWVVILLKAALI